MQSIRRRFSILSTTPLMWSGRLLGRHEFTPVFGSMSQPNLLAITIWALKGARASPTTSSFVKGPSDSAVSKKCDTAFDRRPDERYQLPLVFWQETASVAISHAAETEG